MAGSKQGHGTSVLPSIDACQLSVQQHGLHVRHTPYVRVGVARSSPAVKRSEVIIIFREGYEIKNDSNNKMLVRYRLPYIIILGKKNNKNGHMLPKPRRTRQLRKPRKPHKLRDARRVSSIAT